MSEQIIHKTCNKCKTEKPTSEFHVNNATKDGRSGMCKSCTKSYNNTQNRREQYKKYSRTQNRRESQGRYYRSEKGIANSKRKTYCHHKYWLRRKNDPEEQKKKTARDHINYQIRFKEMPKASELLCEKCGTQAQEYHHHKGYEQENLLDVIPLCKSCHKFIHRI